MYSKWYALHTGKKVSKKGVKKKHPIFSHATLNIGTIGGGIGVTFVPEYCEISFDRWQEVNHYEKSRVIDYPFSIWYKL